MKREKPMWINLYDYPACIRFLNEEREKSNEQLRNSIILNNHGFTSVRHANDLPVGIYDETIHGKYNKWFISETEYTAFLLTFNWNR